LGERDRKNERERKMRVGGREEEEKERRPKREEEEIRKR